MLVLQNIWWFLVLIGVMILIHELGHFWAARFFDVRVETFSFGFGPRLFGFKRVETDFRFSAILFGGYVKMVGEQPGEETSNDPRGFLVKPRWQRLIIAFAGPFMNIILAIGILTGLFMVRFPKIPSTPSPTVGYVVPEGAAAKAATEAGAEHVGFKDLIQKVQEGFQDFDVAVATPAAMAEVRKLGKVLGPRGLMPNPKAGTVAEDTAKAVQEVKAGRVEFKLDKNGNVAVPVGKFSFQAKALVENSNAVIEAVVRARPATAKGRYLDAVTLSATMSPGLKLDPSPYLAGQAA